jgi:hypothetical protein
MVSQPSAQLPNGVTLRLAEDAAYGLRWTEIVMGISLDPRRSLVGVRPETQLLPNKVGADCPLAFARASLDITANQCSEFELACMPAATLERPVCTH